MVVEKDIGGKSIFPRYLPAGSYFGEMAVLSGEKRNATVKAAVGSAVIKLTGAGLRAMLAGRPQGREAADRKGGGEGKSGAVGVVVGGGRISKTKKREIK